jgi:ribosome recycling factor
MEPFVFVEGNTKDFENMLKDKMQAPLKHFEKELASLRTGRASSSMIEHILVDSYGQMMPIKNVATISVPDARLITIQPWDKTLLPEIEKAIVNSNLGVAPANDGEIIRLQLPQMSSAHREELTKDLGKKAEESRIGIRNIRKDFHNHIRDIEKKRGISEDFAKRLTTSLQKATDEFIGKIDALQEKKTKELIHV